MVFTNNLVICVDNTDWEDCLTEGRAYRVLDVQPAIDPETGKTVEEYRVLDDLGVHFYFDESRFMKAA